MTNAGTLHILLYRRSAIMLLHCIVLVITHCKNIFIGMIVLLVVVMPVSGNALECDNSLTPTKDATRYSLRNNRCEGFYSTKKVAGVTLDLIGFIKGRFDYAANEDEIIDLSLPVDIPAEFNPVYVQAKPFSSLTYYRMDALLERGESLKWPVKDVLLAKNIQAKHIRAYGEYRYKSEKSNVDSTIIIPLIAESSITKNASTSDSYMRLYLRSLEDIDYLSQDWHCTNGQKHSDKQEEIVRASKPIIIFVPKELTGTCLVDIQAILMNRDSGGEGNRVHKQLILQMSH